MCSAGMGVSTGMLPFTSTSCTRLVSAQRDARFRAHTIFCFDVQQDAVAVGVHSHLYCCCASCMSRSCCR